MIRHLRWVKTFLAVVMLLSVGCDARAQIVDLGSRVRLERQSITRVSGTPGELEVAASEDGQSVVVAVNNLVGNAPFTQDTVFFSSDGGATFVPSNLAKQLRNRRDPTIARAGSGAFFYAAMEDSNIVLGRSTDNGATFDFVNNAGAVCVPDPSATSCTTDQPHIAADPRNLAAGDQIYVVWRETDVFGNGRETQMIQCSVDGGVTWQPPVAVGRGILARVAAGPDGRVYVVFADRRTGAGSIFLQRFSPCSEGLVAAFSDTPARPVTPLQNVPCPVPGLDRCNDGNILSSPTVAVDQSNGGRVFVTWSERIAPGNEAIMAIASTDGGETFTLGPTRVSSDVTSRKFMPWTCGGAGQIFVGWYDRRAATAQITDNTQYFVRSVRMVRPLIGGISLRVSDEVDLTGGVADPQCASGWPHAPRNTGDAENCSIQPQLAGVCAPTPADGACNARAAKPIGCVCARQAQCAAGTTCSAGHCIAAASLVGGAAPRCDFSNPACAAGEACQLGRGAPKYGDYNGIACTGRSAFLAWASGTPPAGATGAGFGVFLSRVDARFEPARLSLCDRIPCNFRPVLNANTLDLLCNEPGCIVIDPIPDNCKRKFECPGCRAGGLCPPEYRFVMEGLDKVWGASLVDGAGAPVKHTVIRMGTRLDLTFRPEPSTFSEGMIGDYYIVFRMGQGGVPRKLYRVKTRLEVK